MTAAKPKARKTISLALQGGGSHGAFTWGVLDRLLEHGGLDIRAATGASAGAMNAVALAAGMLEGDSTAVRAKLEAFWRGVSRSSGHGVFGDDNVWLSAFDPTRWMRDTPAWKAMEGFAGNWSANVSPYDFNPLDLNPLRDLLNDQIDFSALRERSPLKLFVGATAVHTGKVAVFRESELTSAHVMASACLPHLFHAVEIDGEPYWDGGYTANPPIWPLFYEDTPDDILLVTVNPFVRKGTPRTPVEIMDRLNEISFNATLAAELRSAAFVARLIDEGMLADGAKGRYRRMNLHAVIADGRLDDLSAASKSDTSWDRLQDLKLRGRAAADDWLEHGFRKVGIESSVDVQKAFL